MGKIDREMLLADIEFTDQLSSMIVRGYHFWAVPYVRVMRRKDWLGKLATAVILPVSLWRGEEVMFRMGRSKKGNLKGKFVRWIVEAGCYAIGLFVSETDYQVLYCTR